MPLFDLTVWAAEAIQASFPKDEWEEMFASAEDYIGWLNSLPVIVHA
jgi:hypothetical protein